MKLANLSKATDLELVELVLDIQKIEKNPTILKERLIALYGNGSWTNIQNLQTSLLQETAKRMLCFSPHIEEKEDLLTLFKN